jgi:alpha-beta hydrolase superfamily lysophospholipase
MCPARSRYRWACKTCHATCSAVRHETLNETNRNEVVAALLAWFARIVR